MDPVWMVSLIIVLLYLFSCINILAEYERGVLFVLGRVSQRPIGPGLVFIFRPICRMVRVSLRLETLEVPPQDIVTRDNVTVKVNAVIFFRVIDPQKAVLEVSNFLYTTSQLAQTTLRSILGEAELDELLSQRETLNVRLQGVLDTDTAPWGIKVAKVEVKQVDLPDNMIRAIARQAEAERERRAKIIHADGEFMASEKLSQAAGILEKEPAAIQLRYLQTLVEIGAEKNTTVVFPVPVDILAGLSRLLDRTARPEQAAPPQK
jgi:regulator of protease activity HflC (stomatin/prohibitin superfamily)